MTILITGDKNIGKTTIINNIITKYSDEIIGLQTKEYFKNGKRQGFYMTEIFSDEQPSEKNIIATMNKDFRPEVNEEVFENTGVFICNKILSSKKRICIIDEIGIFERNSKHYVELLYKILNQKDKIVLCVVSNKEHDFLYKIKENREVITLNEQNRDKVSDNLINRLSS